MLSNLDRVKVFHQVFEHGSVVGAARTLHVSQSAVSQTVQKLEREIGTPLFTRLHKQLVPTKAGEQLFAISHPFMTALSSYLREQATARDHPSGELRIGAPPEFGKAYLPSVVAGFRKLYPAVTFSLEFGTPETLLPMLRNGRLDFALLDVFLTHSTHVGHLDHYHFNPVVEEEVILAASRRFYDREIAGDHSYDALACQPFISYQEGHQTVRQWFRHHFGKVPSRIRDVLTVASHGAVITAILNDLGLGVVASHLVSDELREGAIVHIATRQPGIMNPIALVHLQDKIPTLTERVFEKFLIERIQKMLTGAGVGLKILEHHRKTNGME